MNTFYNAIVHDDFEKVKEMVQRKPEHVNIISNGLSKADEGMSPLQIALSRGYYEIADYLIDNGADVNFIESPESTDMWRAPVIHDAIIRAVMHCRYTSVNRKGEHFTRFTKEDFETRFAILKKLVDKGADVSSVDSYGNSSVMRFCLDCDQYALPKFSWRKQCTANDLLVTDEVVEDLYRIYHLLLEHGADLSYIDPKSNRNVLIENDSGPIAELLRDRLNDMPEDPEVVIFRGRNLPKERYDLIYSSLDESTKLKDRDIYISSRENVIPQLYEGSDIPPEKGDIFLYRTNKGTEFKGIVINTHVKDRSYEKDTSEWACVALFKLNIDPKEAAQRGIHKEDLIFNVRMVSMNFWKEGFFKKIDYTDMVNIDSYAFYTVDYFVDEYHIPFKGIPSIWGAWDRCNGDFAFAYAVEFYMLTGSDYTEEVEMK